MSLKVRQLSPLPSSLSLTGADTVGHFDGELRDQTALDVDIDRRSAYVNSYINYPAEHAPSYLQRMIDNFMEARWIPCGFSVFSLSDYEHEVRPFRCRRTETKTNEYSLVLSSYSEYLSRTMVGRKPFAVMRGSRTRVSTSIAW